MKTQRRGRNAEGSASDKWMGNILQMRKEAVPFLESLGIPKPRSKAEWSYIFKEMGTFLAAKNFIVNCPLPVMELPVAPSTTARRPCVSGRSVTSASRSRCSPAWWRSRSTAVATWSTTGWSRSRRRRRAVGLLPPLGCLWPRGGAAKESDPKAKILAGADTTLRTPDQGTRRNPPITTSTVTAVRARSTSTSTSRRQPSTCSGPRWSAAWSCPASAHGKWWARRSSRPPGATCAGSARASGRRAVGGQGCGVAQGQGHLPAAGDGRAPGAAI